MTKVITYDTRHTVREAYPKVATMMAVWLVVAPLGFIPKSLFNLPLWFNILCVMGFVTFAFLGLKWEGLYTVILCRRANKMSRMAGVYEISYEETAELRAHYVAGEITMFRGVGRQFVRFTEDQDRVLFLIGRAVPR